MMKTNKLYNGDCLNGLILQLCGKGIFFKLVIDSIIFFFFKKKISIIKMIRIRIIILLYKNKIKKSNPYNI